MNPYPGQVTQGFIQLLMWLIVARAIMGFVASRTVEPILPALRDAGTCQRTRGGAIPPMGALNANDGLQPHGSDHRVSIRPGSGAESDCRRLNRRGSAGSRIGALLR